MTIQQFIEKAIEGGWKNSEYEWATTHIQDTIIIEMATRLALLDPHAWQAVGKVEGWSITQMTADGKPIYDISNWHAMIDALATEKTIEEFLATL